MSSPAQIFANRSNAQASTGPRSDEGKSKSSQNAARHQLTARGLIVLPGQESAFQQLELGLRTGLQPSGEIQEVLFTRLLESAWNLHRCRLAEAKLYSLATDQDTDPLLDDQNEAKYARIQKYARQNESSMLKMARELGKLQTEMQYRKEGFPLTPAQTEDPEQFNRSVQALPQLCQVDKVTAKLISLPNSLNKPKSAEAAFIELMEKTCAPPQPRPTTARLALAKAAGR